MSATSLSPTDIGRSLVAEKKFRHQFLKNFDKIWVVDELFGDVCCIQKCD